MRSPFGVRGTISYPDYDSLAANTGIVVMYVQNVRDEVATAAKSPQSSRYSRLNGCHGRAEQMWYAMQPQHRQNFIKVKRLHQPCQNTSNTKNTNYLLFSAPPPSSAPGHGRRGCEDVISCRGPTHWGLWRGKTATRPNELSWRRRSFGALTPCLGEQGRAP